MADEQTPSPAPKLSDLADKASKGFQEWWDANIPNSPFSRNGDTYNTLFEARQRTLAALANIKE